MDLPWDEAPGWEGVPWDREARPSLDEVVAVRRLRGDSHRARLAAGGELPLKECLRIVLNEEWEHRLYAERDLTILEKEN